MGRVLIAYSRVLLLAENVGDILKLHLIEVALTTHFDQMLEKNLARAY
jgi:hypothetical protein